MRVKRKRFASPLAKEKAGRVKSILDTSPGCLPTIDSLVITVHLNRICLQRAFRELNGMTIAEYGRQIKIRRIKELLGDFTLTLDAIAEMTGYNGGPALTRFFKQMEGVSPGSWRRRN
jgi:two-component system response regulator YesN